jgi:excisionase family DNA binding protein
MPEISRLADAFERIATALENQTTIPGSQPAVTENQSIQDKEILTDKETAFFLGVADRTLRDWRKRGKGPAFVQMGSKIRYRKTDIDEYLEQSGQNYLISDTDDLKKLLAFGQNTEYCFALVNDIDLATEPGFYIPYFRGNFDGFGHKISNLDVDLMILTFDREDFLSNLSGRNISREMRLQDVLSLFPACQEKFLLSTMEDFLAGNADVPALKVKFNDTDNWIVVKGLVVSRNSAGKPVTLIGAVRDVTNSVMAENELLGLNLMLKNLLARMPVGLYWKDVNLQYKGASRVFLDDTGASSEEYLDDNLLITEKSRQIEKQVLETGRSVINRLEKVCLSGSREKIVNISRVPLRSPDDLIIGLMVTYTDVTENIQFRDQLIQRKKFLSGLVDNLPVGFFAKDPSSSMTYRIWNREMEEIFGFSASEAVELKDWNLFGTKAAVSHMPSKGKFSRKDTDAYALAEGLVSITPLGLDLTSRNCLDKIAEVFDSERLNEE